MKSLTFRLVAACALSVCIPAAFAQTQPAPAGAGSLMFPVAPVKQPAENAGASTVAATPPRAELQQIPQVRGQPTPAKIESMTERPTGPIGPTGSREVDRLVTATPVSAASAARAAGVIAGPSAQVATQPARPKTPAADAAARTAPTAPAAMPDAVQTGLPASVLAMLDVATANQGTITVQPGSTELIPIARGALNRVVTPFDTVRARHSLAKESGASISAAENVIYVGTYGDAPISAFLVDSDDESRAISVVFVPRDIPPRDLRLKLASAAPAAAGAAPTMTGAASTAGSTRDALAWEQSQPYVDGLKSLLRTLALSEMPPGYNLVDPAASATPRCTAAGVRMQLGQVLEGGRLTVAVHRAVNTTDGPVNVQESGCYQPGVLAVAAWPRAMLQPGEDTELYVVWRKDRAEARSATRPSLLQGADAAGVQ